MLVRTPEASPPKTATNARAPVAARDWEAAVGSRIAMRTMPARLERGVLHVRVASATWAQELSLLSDPIITQLRARGVAVDTLRFRVGKVEVPERIKTREEVRMTPRPVSLPSSLSGQVDRVQDEELREAIRHAAEKNLGWQQMIGKLSKSGETNDRPNEPAATRTTPDARDLRSVGPETFQPAPAEETTSASPRRTCG